MKRAELILAAWTVLGFSALARSDVPEFSLFANQACYLDGSTVTVTVDLSSAPAPIVGGQFTLSYDKTKLTFVSADPSATVWTVQIFESVNTEAGTIDYSVGIPNGGSGATSGTMAILTFTAAAEVCNSAGLVAFRAHTPPTKAIDENNVGYVVGTTLVANDLVGVSIDSTAPAATTAPGAGDAALDCDDSAGLAAALAFVPEFSDNCTAALGPDIISDDSTPDGNGGYVRVRTWTATDDCGNASAPYGQTITVTADCDDANPCTVDSCTEGGCFHDPLPSGSGDANADSFANGSDIQGFVNAVFNGPSTPNYCAVDMNADGTVDLSDLPGFVAVLIAG